MNCCVYAINSAQADQLRQNPESILDLLSAPNVNLCGTWYDFHCVVASADINHPPPHGFLVGGGEEIDGTDGGYGPARLFPPDDVKDISSVLGEVGEEEFEPIQQATRGSGIPKTLPRATTVG